MARPEDPAPEQGSYTAPPPDPQELVLLGEELLDLALPDWRKYIELDEFDILDGDCCILGQLSQRLDHLLLNVGEEDDLSPYHLGAFSLLQFALSLPDDVGSSRLRDIINAEKAEIAELGVDASDPKLTVGYDLAVRTGFCPNYHTSELEFSAKEEYVKTTEEVWRHTITKRLEPKQELP